MFGRKKTKSPIRVTRLSSLVAANVDLKGDVDFTEGLRVDGHILGSITNRDGTPGLLVLSAEGVIEGDIHVYDAVINGKVTGKLHVTHFLELQSQARVVGNISYAQLQMDCGAIVQGELRSLETPESDKVIELNSAKG